MAWEKTRQEIGDSKSTASGARQIPFRPGTYPDHPAQELRPFAERLITISRKGDDLHARRRVLRTITNAGIVRKLFDTIAPRFSDRPGGYLRILKLGRRRGDAAEMAIVELVGSEEKITRRKRYLKKEKETKKTASAGEKGSA